MPVLRFYLNKRLNRNGFLSHPMPLEASDFVFYPITLVVSPGGEDAAKS
jgi:hypothetical protein